MKTTLDKKNKIIKSFCVVGLNEEQLHIYNDSEKSKKYIQNIDILVKKIQTTKNQLIRGDEKWFRAMKDSDTWFRIQYTQQYNLPITDFKMVGCKYDENENCLLIDKKYINQGYYPIRITIVKDNEESISTANSSGNNDNNNLKDIVSILNEYIPSNKENANNNFIKIPKEFNAKEIMNMPVKNNAGVILVNRKYNNLPLSLIKIKYLKDNNYQFHRTKHKMSPFKYKYKPEILDQ